MSTISAAASFPEGSKHLGLLSASDINQHLSGRTIVSVRFEDFNEILFILDDGRIVKLKPDGLEGDDLSIVIEQS